MLKYKYSALENIESLLMKWGKRTHDSLTIYTEMLLERKHFLSPSVLFDSSTSLHQSHSFEEHLFFCLLYTHKPLKRDVHG